MTDALQLAGESLAKSNAGRYLPRRFLDVLHPAPEDARSGDEIAADVIQKGGLVIKGKEGGGQH